MMTLDEVVQEGSLFKWANEGLPVVSKGEVVKRVHPYNEKWGVLLDKALRWFSE